MINSFIKANFNLKQLDLEIRAIPNMPDAITVFVDSQGCPAIQSPEGFTQPMLEAIAKVIGDHIPDQASIDEQTEASNIMGQIKAAYLAFDGYTQAQKNAVTKQMLRLWYLVLKYYITHKG